MRSRITIKVQPKGSKTKIMEVTDDVIRIKVQASPEKGAANADLLKFLSKKLHIPKSKIEIVSGHTSRLKIIEFEDLDRDEIQRRLYAAKP
ncbi:DUF167 domain-containing protein [bacterium]|nr:DUF167 domain-containing protein [candidate division CSSED10-310 bacterium]